jgi:hypothetical protein
MKESFFMGSISLDGSNVRASTIDYYPAASRGDAIGERSSGEARRAVVRAQESASPPARFDDGRCNRALRNH